MAPTSSLPSEMTGTRTSEPIILWSTEPIHLEDFNSKAMWTVQIVARALESLHSTARSYMESDTVLGMGEKLVILVLSILFFYENMFCNLVSQYSQSSPR